ncbi:MAG: hypothetical protein IJA44_03905 [Clostridia bacterium]|nr:hypothetical protein [Clostridia bacterium]
MPPEKGEPEKPVVTTKTEFNDFYYYGTKFMTFMGDNIYFRCEDGTYCVAKTGGTPKKVTNFFGQELNSANDSIFLKVNPESNVDNITDYEMRYLQYNVKTNKFSKVPHNGSAFKIYNNKLIFFSQGQVYVSNLDGSDAKSITKTKNTGNYIIYNDKIYYTEGYTETSYNNDNTPIILYFYTLHVTDLEGKNDKVLFDISSSEFIIVNDKIVVRDENKICIMNLDGKKNDEFETGFANLSQLNYFNNKLYILSGASLYSFDFDGSDKKLIDDKVSYFEINNNKIYCYNANKICRYNLDGTAREQIFNE